MLINSLDQPQQSEFPLIDVFLHQNEGKSILQLLTFKRTRGFLGYYPWSGLLVIPTIVCEVIDIRKNFTCLCNMCTGVVSYLSWELWEFSVLPLSFQSIRFSFWVWLFVILLQMLDYNVPGGGSRIVASFMFSIKFSTKNLFHFQWPDSSRGSASRNGEQIWLEWIV